MFFGAGDEVTQKLFAARKTAREERMKENRVAGCGGSTLVQPLLTPSLPESATTIVGTGQFVS
jgi:hypothetical protein